MHEHGKSDRPVVPAKAPNNAGRPAAEVLEERGLAKGNTDRPTRPGRSAGPGVPSGLDRVREVARRDKNARFTALLHHVTVARLRTAYRAIRPQAAPGVDGVTWQAYGQDLEANLQDLHHRVHSGGYRARPRPGRKPHDALDALATGITGKKVNWILDADIRDFFTKLDQAWLMKFLEHRIADKKVLRLIRKWLAAGVIEDGSWSETPEGTPQGGSASPLLANVYLHYVLDQWARQWRRRHARGDMIIVRWADDFVVGFQHQGDAKQFLHDLRGRFAKFALELHPGKTRLIEFGRFAAANRRANGPGKPETFDFLGFTHISGKTRGGRFWLRRITIAKRMRAKLRQVKDQLKARRHRPVPEQGAWLASVVRGHLAYYAVPGNARAVQAFRNQVTRHWCKALRRRSQRHHLTWERTNRLAQRWLPPARILHPYPEVRFYATTRGRSPVR